MQEVAGGKRNQVFASRTSSVHDTSDQKQQNVNRMRGVAVVNILQLWRHEISEEPPCRHAICEEPLVAMLFLKSPTPCRHAHLLEMLNDSLLLYEPSKKRQTSNLKENESRSSHNLQDNREQQCCAPFSKLNYHVRQITFLIKN